MCVYINHTCTCTVDCTTHFASVALYPGIIFLDLFLLFDESTNTTPISYLHAMSKCGGRWCLKVRSDHATV